MKRLVVVGVGLLLAPLAWSAGTYNTHDEHAFADSLSATWDRWFPVQAAPAEAPTRDLSSLLLVADAHRQGTGHRVTLDELDARVSDAVFDERVVQEAVNQIWPERMKPHQEHWLAEDVRRAAEPKRAVDQESQPESCGGGIRGVVRSTDAL